MWLLNIYRLAGIHIGDVAFQSLHGPVEEAVDGLVIVLLVGGLDDQGDGNVKYPRVHGSYYYVCACSTEPELTRREGFIVTAQGLPVEHDTLKSSPWCPHHTA